MEAYPRGPSYRCAANMETCAKGSRRHNRRGRFLGKGYIVCEGPAAHVGKTVVSANEIGRKKH
jgi:hypothetical protein